MFTFVFDLPLWLTGPAILIVLWIFSTIGLGVVRRRVLPRLHIEDHDSHFVGTMVHSVMVFYGLAVALMAVNVSETYTDVTKLVSGEATSIAALYRDVSTYPEPIRAKLQGQLRDYVEYTIRDAWPLQRRGRVPSGGVELVDRFQATLTSFEPVTEGQKLVHGETLRAYNVMIQARRLRLDAVGTHLPGVMWFVIIVGAFIGLASAMFFKVRDAGLHRILVLMLATFIGIVIFMIMALDHPFRGDLGIGPDAYELVHDHLMNVAP
jgi:hypothetical protein